MVAKKWAASTPNDFIAGPGRAPSKVVLSGPAKNTALSGIAVAILVVAAIGSIAVFQFKYAPSLFSSSSAATATTSTSSTGPAEQSVAVSILSGAATPNAQGYGPASITVVIGVNATVVWTNNDQAPHTVTSTSAPSGASFDSQNMNPGDVYTHTFTVAGTYQYHCSYHYWMIGTVIVIASGSATTTSSVTTASTSATAVSTSTTASSTTST